MVDFVHTVQQPSPGVFTNCCCIAPPYFLDTFNGAAGTNIIAGHISDSGAAYRPFDGSQNLQLSGTGFALSPIPSDARVTPIIEIPTESYFVEVEVEIPAAVPNEQRYVYLAGRIATAPVPPAGRRDNKFVVVAWTPHYVAGAGINVGMGFNAMGTTYNFLGYPQPTAPGLHTLRLEFESLAVRIYLDGALYGPVPLNPANVSVGTGGYIAFGTSGYWPSAVGEPFKIARCTAGPL